MHVIGMEIFRMRGKDRVIRPRGLSLLRPRRLRIGKRLWWLSTGRSRAFIDKRYPSKCLVGRGKARARERERERERERARLQAWVPFGSLQCAHSYPDRYT